MTTEPDPLPSDRFIGETCSFNHQSKRLTGVGEQGLGGLRRHQDPELPPDRPR